MKKGLLFLLIAFISCLGFSQTATLTNSLNNKLMEASSKDYIKVNVVLVDQVNNIALNQELKERNALLEERAKTVIRKSMQLANSTQASIVSLLNNNNNKVRYYKSYWIINMLSIEARKDIILQLAFLPEVDYIELHDHFTGKPIDVMKVSSSQQKAIGGIEPGLASINAPALWALGYTGKNRKLYSIDTGVWDEHPAIADAWLGNYQPLSQAWNGIDSPVPVDKSSSHGTHTTGTVLGLDQSNNDTIGVAFNAYFMAADPIVDNIANIKPLPEYIDVFQFALNPDGDTTTTDDIPDVINNSWGIDEHHDTSICAGYVTQMFDAIEAAGIANVFSAGNEGPSDTTIGKPQYVSTGLVNTFTVGAVNAHSAGNPIAGFSSRGPTACPASGSIAIKPEVVAPGVNVRSCIDQNNYANYQGTSMAGPHVSGAALLLKEAFPNVSGEEILLALYYSAIDLGIAGEDNTYGMGMIDVKAAYDSLALTYTPTPPNQFYYDLTIQKVTNPSERFICDQNITPKIVLENKGDSSITNASIEYQLNNEPIQNFSWVGTLNSGDTTTVTLPSITALSDGDYELRVKATIDTLLTECDYINNQRYKRFNIRETHAILPYQETFENTKIDSSEWLIDNPDFSITWDTTVTGGLPNSTYSAIMEMYPYGGSGQKDGLISTKISLPVEDSIYLKFDVAYQMVISVIADTLSVYISDDCSATDSLIYKKGGTDLQTQPTVMQPFIPTDSSEWRTDYIDITGYAGKDVIITFETYNKSGNNLYLDNIWVYEGEEPVSIEEVNTDPITIFPNPTSNTITIDIGENNVNNGTIEVFNLLGKIMLFKNVNTRLNTIDLSNYSNGIYIVKFTNESGNTIQKIIKQ